MFGPAGAAPPKPVDAGEELVQGELGWADEFYKNNPQVDSKPLSPLERFHRFCAQGDPVSAKEVLDSDKKLVNQTGAVGNTALHFSSSGGQVPVVQMLLAAGASINVVNDNGDTPLHQAAWKDHVGVVQILAAAGADRSIVNKAGKTAPQMSHSAEMKSALPEFDAKQMANMVVMANDDDDDDDDW